MTATIENTKLENFLYRWAVLQHTLDGNTSMGGGILASLQSDYLSDRGNLAFYPNAFTPAWLYSSENEFVLALVKEMDPRIETSFGEQKIESIESFIRENPLSVPIKKLGEKNIRIPPFGGVLTGTCVNRNHIQYKMIFSWLVALALDTNLYQQYLDYVVDVADIFDFTEDMMQDWCDAAIYWLNGNNVDKVCDLELKSPEGNMFFKGEI